jgi:hypothetical protein
MLVSGLYGKLYRECKLSCIEDTPPVMWIFHTLVRDLPVTRNIGHSERKIVHTPLDPQSLGLI